MSKRSKYSSEEKYQIFRRTFFIRLTTITLKKVLLLHHWVHYQLCIPVRLNYLQKLAKCLLPKDINTIKIHTKLACFSIKLNTNYIIIYANNDLARVILVPGFFCK